MADPLLSDRLMPKQPLQLLRAEQTDVYRGFTKTNSGLEVLEYGTDILPVEPAKTATDLSKTRPPLALPGQGLKDITPFTES